MIPGLVIDSFAGGGGASTGIEAAFARAVLEGLSDAPRYVDYAINHDAEAIAMHTANHPNTEHLPCNVWSVEFDQLVGKRAVAFMWFSPDCKHFSKAKGGKPVKKSIRDLAWVVVKAARQVRPAVIMLENVEEFQDWGPLIFKRGSGGETVGSVNLFQAAEGERAGIPADVVRDEKTGEPVLVPDPNRRGQTFREWTAALTRLGYRIEWRELRACDYGAPTIRKRFFMIARRDGRKIVWPEPTYGDPASEAVKSGKLRPWRTAAEIIDWSLPCPSIFLTKEEGRALGVKRALEEATMARIAKGVKRYVLDAARPFIVNLTHHGYDRTESVDEPFKTVTGAHRGEKAVVAPVFSYAQQGGAVRAPDEPHSTVTASLKDQNQLVAPYLVPRYGEREGQEPRTHSVEKPAPVVVPTANGGSLVTPVIVRTAHGERDKTGKKRGRGEHDASAPLPTVTASPEFGLVASHLTKFRANSVGSGMDEPAPTVTANSYIQRPGGAPPIGVVAAFLAQHNIDGRTGEGHPGRSPEDPMSTVLSSGSHQSVVASHMIDMHGSDMRSAGADEPLRALTAQGFHAGHVAAFMTKYYGTDQDPRLGDPLHTATTKDRFGLVTVMVDGEPYVIADIGMRMLVPRELFGAQSFPPSYIIDQGRFRLPDGSYEWRKLTKTAQIRMCGNSVCPVLAEALTWANVVQDVPMHVTREREAAMWEMPLWSEDAAA